jgi:PTH1 family peptidyl-tRNA hydrolase
VIVGLGNPGKEYENTRHNIGFKIIDTIADRYRGQFKKGPHAYLFAKILIESKSVYLVKPISYMNRSGEAVHYFFQYFKIENYLKVLIVLDDFNLPFGIIRLRTEGNHGGQKGLESIMNKIGTKKIPRLRFGIGNDFYDSTTHVLSLFNRNEKKHLTDLISKAADAVECFILKGINETMNIYNKNYLI